MKPFSLLMGVLILIGITGCKANIETELTFKDLLVSKTKAIQGDLYIEVAGCNSHEDSRKPSSSVLKIQESIPGIFYNAKYIECFSRNFDSYAHFNILITLDKDSDGKLASQDNINIISNAKTLLTIAIPEPLKDRIEKGKKNNNLKLNVNIKLTNDSGKLVDFKTISAYIDGTPYIYQELTAPINSSFVVTLSDVSVDHATQGNPSTVLMF